MTESGKTGIDESIVMLKQLLSLITNSHNEKCEVINDSISHFISSFFTEKWVQFCRI